METLVPKDFKPSERTYSNLKKHGAIPEFVDYELPNMITYFTETKDKKRSWQMTVQRWMRLAFKGKAGRDWEYNRHNKYNIQEKRKIMPAPKLGNISKAKIKEAITMTRNKRLEFADYLSRSMNK